MPLQPNCAFQGEGQEIPRVQEKKPKNSSLANRLGSSTSPLVKPQATQMTSNATTGFITSVRVGGLSTGTAFDDSTTVPVDVTKRPITAIKIRSESYVDSIQVVYSGDSKYSPLAHGGKGGNENTFTLASGDYITEITVWSGIQIDALQFKTKNGVTSDKYGGTGGSSSTVYGGGRQLAYIFGTASDYLWSIGFGFPTKITYYETSLYGSTTGGSEFTDFTYVPEAYMSTAISRVDVRYGTQVDRIQITYDGLTTQPPAHGGSGGSSGYFQLDTSVESITGVNVRTEGSVLRAVQFVSSSGRQSEWFGGSDGSEKSITVPEGYPALMAIGGRSDSRLDAIKFYWGPGISVLYTEFTFSDPPTPSDVPETAGYMTLTNNTSTDQTLAQTFTWSSADTTETTISDSWTLGTKVSVEASIPFLASTTLETTFECTSSTSNTISNTTTKEMEQEFPTTVPANSTATGTVIIYSVSSTDVAFTAKKYLLYPNADGTTTKVDAGTVSGTFTGVNSYRADASWTSGSL